MVYPWASLECEGSRDSISTSLAQPPGRLKNEACTVGSKTDIGSCQQSRARVGMLHGPRDSIYVQPPRPFRHRLAKYGRLPRCRVRNHLGRLFLPTDGGGGRAGPRNTRQPCLDRHREASLVHACHHVHGTLARPAPLHPTKFHAGWLVPVETVAVLVGRWLRERKRYHIRIENICTKYTGVFIVSTESETNPILPK